MAAQTIKVITTVTLPNAAEQKAFAQWLNWEPKVIVQGTGEEINNPRTQTDVLRKRLADHVKGGIAGAVKNIAHNAAESTSTVTVEEHSG